MDGGGMKGNVRGKQSFHSPEACHLFFAADVSSPFESPCIQTSLSVMYSYQLHSLLLFSAFTDM